MHSCLLSCVLWRATALGPLNLTMGLYCVAIGPMPGLPRQPLLSGQLKARSQSPLCFDNRQRAGMDFAKYSCLAMLYQDASGCG